MSLVRVAVAAAVASFAAACSPTVPTQPELPAVRSSLLGGGIQPMCVEGCQDPDPDPEAVGYFLPGLENQWAACADAVIDQDHDGLDDNCEFALASQFRPLMSYATGDDTRHEPRWAAMWVDGDAGSKTVRAAYLPGYWTDMGDAGTSHTLCTTGFWGPFSAPRCNAHTGDSEWIMLDVRYSVTSQHWVLADAYFSAHEWHLPFDQLPDTTLITAYSHDAPWERAVMEYPDRVAGYPRIYVADRKHANYPTNAYCDAHGGEVGGIATNSDDCDGQRAERRLGVGPSRNLGSRSYPMIDCVTTDSTSHPTYGNGRTECYWTPKRFRGWFDASPDADPYSGFLALLGF